MPLDPSALSQGLVDVGNQPTAAAAGAAWAQAIGSYAAQIIPPSNPGAVSGATAALAGALATAFESPSAVPGMELAFVAFAASVGLGMAPLVATPPIGPVGFAEFFQTTRDTREEAAAELAALIDEWMRTGVANTAPPTTPIPWS